MDNRIALQLEYSLVERTIEREHIPAAHKRAMAVCPWSPLASGFPTAKRDRDRKTAGQNSRLEVLAPGNNPVFEKFSDRNWRVLDVVKDFSARLGRPASQVALNWVITQSDLTSTIIGARRHEQLEENLKSFQFDIPSEDRQLLHQGSQLDLATPYMFFESPSQPRITGGVTVRKWS